MAPKIVPILRHILEHPENRGHRAGALARFVGWQVWQRTLGRPLTIDLRSRIGRDGPSPKLRCYPHSYSASSVLYCGYYEFQDMHFVADWLDAGDVFVDVGANIGVFSLVASTVSGVETWSFEPSTVSSRRAAENIALNRLGDRIHLVRAAVGAHDGSVALTTGFDVMNRIVDSAEVPSTPGEQMGRQVGETEVVDLVMLDSVLPQDAKDRVALIKFDVEGTEEDAIAGADGVIAGSLPALIVEAFDPAAIRAVLEPFGYVPVHYAPVGRKLTSASWSDPAGNNLLLVHDFEQAVAKLAR